MSRATPTIVEPVTETPSVPEVGPILRSSRLADIRYEIRGPVAHLARRLEEAGHRIVKLNIGNLAPFGLEAPADVVRDVIHQLPKSQGYEDSRGLHSARRAVMQECQRLNFPGVDIDDIFLGNGVSELILLSLHAYLNDGDEVLVPMPDYPLWTAAVRLAGGVPVHYRCDEGASWNPDIADIRRRTTSRTRGIVVINPNNPTGAVYDRSVLQELASWARKSDLIVFADEIYSRITYDDASYIPFASLDEDILVLTFDGLSKAFRLAGFRCGWLIVSGAKHRAQDLMFGIEQLAGMRLCANVPAQHAVPVALGGYQDIKDLTRPGGRLYEQRNYAWERLNSIEGVSCSKPNGAIYLFPRLSPTKHRIFDDEQFAIDFLKQQKVLVIHGGGFNLTSTDHFRMAFLPTIDELAQVMTRLEAFLYGYSQVPAKRKR